MASRALANATVRWLWARAAPVQIAVVHGSWSGAEKLQETPARAAASSLAAASHQDGGTRPHPYAPVWATLLAASAACNSGELPYHGQAAVHCQPDAAQWGFSTSPDVAEPATRPDIFSLDEFTGGYMAPRYTCIMLGCSDLHMCLII